MLNILAFNITHDSSVTYLENGELKFFCKEERISRIKRDSHPFKSLEIFKNLNYKPDHVLYMTPSNSEPDIFYTYKKYTEKFFNRSLENFSNLNHHDSHAMLAFCNSGFEEALIVVIDRNGSIFFIDNESVAREAESVYVAFRKDNSCVPIYKNFFLNVDECYKTTIEQSIRTFYPNTCDVFARSQYGIVTVYEAATTLIGQEPLENGKTMGLSSYSLKKDFPNLFYNGFVDSKFFMKDLSRLDERFRNLGTCFFEEHSNINDNINNLNYKYYAEKAKHVQVETQDAALELIKKYVNKTSIKNVCIVGGYGLNVISNNYYLKNLPNVNFYFEPCADDTGISIGGAMLKHFELTGEIPNKISNKFYHYYEDNQTISHLESKTSISEIVLLLQQQKSIAIFEGAPESGPRALGHRSIIFDPRNSDCKDIINKTKKREWYRPFAGVILEEKLLDYFENIGIKKSEDMTVNFQALEHTSRDFPGIIHVDNTSRMQTVSTGFFYELLKEFYNETGCPMLLNTSFNLAGQPLVHSKQDAFDTFYNSDIDYLLFVDEMIIIKK